MGDQQFVIEQPRIVIPEGNAERNILEKLCSLNAVIDVQVAQKFDDEGNTRIGDKLLALSSIDDFDTVAAVLIVIDNDENPATAFADVQTLIGQTNAKILDHAYPIPATAWVTEAGTPRITVATLPEANVNGCLETLIWAAMGQANQEGVTDVGGFLANKPTGGHHRLTAREKAHVSTYISATCMDDPDCTIGWMWQSNKGYVDLLADAVFEPIIDTLRNF